MVRYNIMTRQAIADEVGHVFRTDEHIQEELQLNLGDGPMRFGGPIRQERVIREELKGLPIDKVRIFAGLKAQWEVECKGSRRIFTDHQILRIISYCKFNQEKGFALMRKVDPRHFNLTYSKHLERQLQTKTLFPVPGLKTVDNASVFYMRPSRFSPKWTPTSRIIDNLVYVMNTLMVHDITASRRARAAITADPRSAMRAPGDAAKWAAKAAAMNKNEGGLAFIANMNDWTMSNFSTDYCMKFMQCLQGKHFPAKVSLFLIVNPPQWFGKVWSIMKPMLSKSFAKRVHMIPEDELWSFLQVGYEEFLPDEFLEGQVNTDQLVQDFCKYRDAIEVATGMAAPTGGRSVMSTLCTPVGKPKVSESLKTNKRRRGFRFFRRKAPLSGGMEIIDHTDDSSVVSHVSVQ